MFHISPDQTQWFHLYRVQKVYPVTFVLFACQEMSEQGISSRLLDLRIICNDQTIMGNSWTVKSDGYHGKQVTRADCTKWLELYAKLSLSNSIRRGIDEIELVESSREELSLAAELDENLRTRLVAVVPTLISKLARSLMSDLSVSHAGLEIVELTDWPTRNPDAVA